MKRFLVVLMVLIAAMVVGYFTWPKKAGAFCNWFRSDFEKHCLGSTDKNYDAVCQSVRSNYDDSMRERSNDEKQCEELHDRFYKIELDVKKRQDQKELDDLDKMFK